MSHQHRGGSGGSDLALPARLVHGICHYHRQWIPGDERGFRTRNHRIHSSGNYKHRPPEQEHAGLRRWVNQAMTGPPVRLNALQRAAVGAAFVAKLQRMHCIVVILACGPTHVHVLFEPTEHDVMRQLGKAKQFASLKCPDRAGQLWAELSELVHVRSEAHAHEIVRYIAQHHIDEGAWVWRYDRDAPPTI